MIRYIYTITTIWFQVSYDKCNDHTILFNINVYEEHKTPKELKCIPKITKL